MAYQLPDGTCIVIPRAGNSFVINGCRHPELNLNSAEFREAWGVVVVPDPVAPPETPEQIADRELRERQEARKLALKEAVVGQYEMILALYRVGRDKGIWTISDFPADLVAKTQEWQQLILDFRAEE